jgi:HSP20 family protein
MSLNIVVMNNLINKLTASPRAGRYSPIFEIFNDFDRILTPESFSNDNIRFNESKENFHVEIDLPGVKKKDLKVTYNEDTNVAYVEAKRTITSKTGSKEETYTRSFRLNPSDFDVDKFVSKLSDGVLTITAPRKKEKEHKVIDVQID